MRKKYNERERSSLTLCVKICHVKTEISTIAFRRVLLVRQEKGQRNSSPWITSAGAQKKGRGVGRFQDTEKLKRATGESPKDQLPGELNSGQSFASTRGRRNPREVWLFGCTKKNIPIQNTLPGKKSGVLKKSIEERPKRPCRQTIEVQIENRREK